MHVIRIMTVGFGALALYAVYRASRLLFSDHPWAPLGATALIGFNPAFIFMSSTVHHDALQAAIFALAVWWALRFLQKSERWCAACLGGALTGVALLTKLSGLNLIPVMGITLFLKAWKERSWRTLVPQSLILFAVAGLMAGWWFIRNQLLYGDPWGWQMFLNLYEHVVRSDRSTWQVYLVDDFLARIGRTFWGGFGYMHITFPEITKYLWLIAGLAGIGLIVGLLRRRFIPRSRWPEWLVVFVVLFLLLTSFVRHAVAVVGSGHGRYMSPAAVSIGALMIAGLNGFTLWRHQRVISIVTAAGMLAYAIWLPAKFVLPKYAPPETITADQLAEAKPVGVILADSIELAGYRISEELAIPGRWMQVDLYWQASGTPDERLDPRIRLVAVDDYGNVLDQHAFWPVPSLSPDVWAPGLVYITRVPLGIPSDGLAGQVHVRMCAFLKGDDGSCLHAEDALGHQYDDGEITLESILAIGAVTEVSADDVPNPRRELFASTLTLSGFKLPTAPVSSGSVVPISLYWHVLEKPAADYTVFIHVLNDQGELETQFDRPPGGGLRPPQLGKWGRPSRTHTLQRLVGGGLIPGQHTLVLPLDALTRGQRSGLMCISGQTNHACPWLKVMFPWVTFTLGPMRTRSD